MAQIREYNNQQVIQQDPLQTAARRQEVLGIEAGGEIQSGANALAEGVKRTEEHIAQTETSKVAADLATAHANLSKQWNDTVASADPNDHELAQRFIDQNVRPTFDKIGQGLITQQGQEYFQRASASAHAELFIKTSADQARLAGEAAVTNLDTLRNQQSNMVRQDPTTLQHALDTASDESLTRLFPTLPAEARLNLGRSMRADFAKSAAEGAIDQNADSAKAALERGDLNDHLDGPTVQTLIQRANERIKANENGNKAAEIEQHRQDKAAFDTFMAKSQASLIDPDSGEVRVPPNYFQNLAKAGEMPGAEAGAISAARDAGERLLTNSRTKTDPKLFTDLASRITTDNPPTKKEIFNHVGNDLTVGDANFLLEKTKEMETPNSRPETELKAAFFKMIRQKIVTPNGFPRVDKDEMESDYFKAYMNMNKAYDDGKKQQKTPQQLLDENSPDYIGKDLKTYQGQVNDNTFVEPPKKAEPFSTTSLDLSVRSGVEGSPKGVAALQAAVKAGQIDSQKAKAYAVRRGWVSIGEKPAAATLPTVPAAQ